MRSPNRKHRVVFISLMLVLVGCFIMGCSTQTPSPQPNETKNITDFGFRAETVSPEQQAINFTEVAANLVDLRFDTDHYTAVNASPNNHILYIRGNNLNENGVAEIWTCAIRHNNKTSIVTYDRHGRNVVDWTGIFTQQEIQMDSIITPEDLFLKNRAAIIRDTEKNLTVSRNLVLSADNYTLTISGDGENRVLEFNAKTGALTS
ncbi:MAG: hypothetical protein Q7T80_01095 [Methanoregula sp.]|nr:hypothetical protein [Methanoregula sp.]